jgi:hypothetical protein
MELSPLEPPARERAAPNHEVQEDNSDRTSEITIPTTSYGRQLRPNKRNADL